MVDYQLIKQLSVKYQTREENVLREYLQHLFLYYFYLQSGSKHFLFKGGTALRLVYGSPRFSEDLDFTGLRNGHQYERILLNTLSHLVSEGIEVNLEESKKTSGGWLATFQLMIFNQAIFLRNEISLRTKESNGEPVLISSDFIPAYQIFILKPRFLVEEKVQALLTRNKARDIFDFYFILRNENLRKLVKLSKKEQERLLMLLEKSESKLLQEELRHLLPISFNPILRDLSKRVINELKK